MPQNLENAIRRLPMKEGNHAPEPLTVRERDEARASQGRDGTAHRPDPHARDIEWRQPISCLQEDGALLIQRGRRRVDGERKPVLVVAPALDPPAPAVLERLTHEYALRDELDGSWAAKPLELARERGRTLLVLEDPGGEPLAQLLGRPLETGRFLRIASGLAAAVREVHRRGLIHKDLRPANILVDEADGRVHLMGFGLASRLPREHAFPEPPEILPEMLAYVAPEQTGRMNRSVDTRSDIYSLGVILYEMLTGAPPFSASDPMEWVHCHIARAPEPPTRRTRGIPEAISAIVMKCLAKAAEDRYQTAAGLAADLARCQEQWRAEGRLTPFEPGARDVPDVLRIPEKLYGREREVAALLDAFEQVRSEGKVELVLVSGSPGVGKSSVVHELHKALVPSRGLFAAGKFDRYKRDIPYSTLALAFQGLIRPLFAKSEAELGRWRDELRAALEPNGALMVDLAPDLKLIIGEQPPAPELPREEAEHRYRLTVRRFIGVFARPEHPLVLFLDDLQWLDAATLALLVDLAPHPEVGSLLLVGAYRDNEVDATHPLKRSLEAIREAGASVRDIVLKPLARDDVGRLVGDALHRTPEAVASLAELVYDRTGGNPFFAIQFLTALADEKLLAFDSGAGGWVWDLQRVRARQYTDNVADLMLAKLGRLPQPTQDALRRLAALGNTADFATLALVLERPADEVHALLWEAVRAGLVISQECAYAFLHDRVQEAAYSLIPEESRAETHLHIGRALWSGFTSEEIGERIFEVVSQLNRGAALIESPEERERVAELDLIAGKRAKSAIAYASALAFFAAGAQILGPERGAARHDLAFALELNRAECELLTGDLEAADQRLAILWLEVPGPIEQGAVASLRVQLYWMKDRNDLAVAACLEYMRQVGVDWPLHPSDEEVRQEFDAIRRRIGERPVEALVDLPLMTDPEQRAIVDVLVKSLLPATGIDANLIRLFVGRAVNLSLEHGSSDASCLAYVWAGAILRASFDDEATGFNFGKLAYDLVGKPEFSRLRAEVYLNLAQVVFPWSRRLREGIDLTERARACALETGNLSWAGYASFRLIKDQLAAGYPLAEVEKEAERALELLQKARWGIINEMVTIQLRLVRTLRGLTPVFGRFNDEGFDEAAYEAHLEGDRQLVAPLWSYWLARLQASVFSGDYAAAFAAAGNAQAKAHPLAPFLFMGAEGRFYAALACAGHYDEASPDERARDLAALREHGEQIAAWARNCPENFQPWAALVDAEIARIEGRDLEAIRLYDQAIGAARDGGFIQIEALADELAGRFYLSRGVESTGLAHLRNARAGYALWGADGKVKQFDRFYPRLATRDPVIAAAAAGSITRQLDVSTLVRASQAISAEIELPRLIQTLMTITLQNAGASRGLLLLSRGDAFEIAAEAKACDGTIAVELRRDVPTETDCPETLVNYVAHTGQSVILDDVSRPGALCEGSVYLRRGPARSALCLPLLRLGKTGGLLYLENSRATYAFTPERVVVLETLAARAAIALENARLYLDLQEREARIRRLVESNIIGIFLWTLDGTITEANDAFLAMVGRGRDEVLSGRVSWSEMTPAEWRDGDERATAELKATGRCEPFEKEFLRKDGDRIPVLVGAAAFSDTPDEGVAFVLDLTERKQAELRQKVMVDELNHRVKNTLATVMALSAQTFRTSPSPQAFRAAFQSRLTALSKTHDLLNRECWTGVSLRELVEQEAAPHAQAGDGRLELAGAEVRLGPIAAVTLGMALHELAVNAAKFGALSVPEGRVRVSWGPSAPGQLRLEWKEIGGPQVEPSERRGFGSELIGRVLPRELGGEVRLDFAPEGVRCTMEMALDRVTGH